MATKNVKVYQACSWFNPEQKNHMDNVYQATKDNKTVDWGNSYRPLDYQFEGVNVDENPEFLEDHYKRLAWISNTYNNDISGMKNAEVGIFAYVPGQDTIDDGTAFELGFMTALNKPTVVVIPDDKEQEPMNLMVAEGATQVVTLSEFKDMDLNKVVKKPFDKTVF